MRIGLLAAMALALQGCGPKPLALPDDPTDKAATCGVVEAATDRQNANSAKGALPFDDQGRILHYAMLAASAGGHFDQKIAAAVVARMSALQDDITKRRFETLVRPCQQAYPATIRVSAITLPADPSEARLGCYELGSYLNRSMQSQNMDYGNRLAEYGSLRRRLDEPVATILRQRGARSQQAQDKARDTALAGMVQIGSPMAVMKQCLIRYPDPAKKAAA